MHILNADAILKDSPEVLSWNDDIYLVHYVQGQESEQVNISIRMNLISLVLNGRKEVLHHAGKMVVPAGSGFFMKKGSYLMTERIADPGRGYEAITILFSDAWLQTEIAHLSVARSSKATVMPGDMALLPEDELMTLLTTQFRNYFTSGAARSRVQSLLPLKIRELFHVLLSAPQQQDFATLLHSLELHPDPDLAQLMQAHYKENLSLEQYAFLAHCSLSTFKRKFMQAFKMPPRKWIQQRRLEEAYYLLHKTGKNITEVAYEVGFESPAHFISSFKEQYGQTPKQLQQQWLSTPVP